MISIMLFVLLELFVGPTYAQNKIEKVPLIILGMDGYGYQLYQEFGNRDSGANHVIPAKTVFPSKTFPNFMSIATGLYPTQHGVVSNAFLHKNEDEYFVYEDEQHQDFDWFHGEPIWITAKKAGLRVYVDMWVGSTAKYDGIRPDYYSKYDKTKTLDMKTSDLIKNMDSPNESCDLYMLYTNQPDSTLHTTNLTDSTAVRTVIEKAEQQLTDLRTALGDRQYNLIVVSDHGMSPYLQKMTLSTALTDTARKYYDGTVPMWYTKDGDNVEERVATINQYLASQSMDTWVVARSIAKLPPRFQLCGRSGEGLPEIIMLLKDETVLDSSILSGHGYDNEYTSMYGQVRMYGSGFTTANSSVTDSVADSVTDMAVMNTELYNMFCAILGIVPADNTGKLDTLDSFLVTPPNRKEWENSYKQIPLPCDSALHLGVPALAYVSVALFIIQYI